MSSATSTSLSLRALLKSAVVRAGLLPTANLSGVTPPAQALSISALASDAPVLVVVPTDAAVDAMVRDARFFLGALEGLAPAVLERCVLPFPSHEVDPYRGLAPHLDVASARARALHALATGQARIIVASAAALAPRLSPPERLLRATAVLQPGTEIAPDTLGDLLADAGFTREDPVDVHGEYCVRGGVVDVFPAGDDLPIRVEFVGESVESIRHYDPATQRSVESIDHAPVVPLREIFEVDRGAEANKASAPAAMDRSSDVLEYLTRRTRPRVVLSEPADVDTQGRAFDENVRTSFADAVARGQSAPDPETLIVAWSRLAEGLGPVTTLEELEIEAGGDRADARGLQARAVQCQPVGGFRGRLPDWVADIRRAREQGDTVLFVVATSGRTERALELLHEYELTAMPIEGAEATHGVSVLLVTGHLSRGFRLPEAGLLLYAESDVFEEERHARERRRAAARAFLSDFRDLKIGDHVVHVDHGIGMFVGLKKLEVGSEPVEFMELRYADEAKLFVPVERLDLVQKYSGATRPALDRLGGTSWEKAKTRVKKAMRDMAEELLKLYAARKAIDGFAFGPDTHWQEEFEAAFEYDLTPDQQAAIEDIKRDMEASSPMDRLLCGDVGYGKTEVAMRAAFKAVMDGKQVAFLAPTTVLALQHLKTLQARFAAFPVRIDMVSRFRSKAEQKATLEHLVNGRLDIIVGTHRLLSKDVKFHDLGLLVVDEEQRFGVAHKERLKQLRKNVDVLTMSATPIPRTLNMSLVGIRDMSVIETPPRDRIAIQTHVVKFDQKVIADAVRREIERGGQVYFVHNRVESIYSMGNLLQRLVPSARIGIGHGQMAEDELERVMVNFVGGAFDVLLATTIIENGLDIPNANTMVINRADRYGLAQLYQLRGRVGRSDRRAYAYLLTPPADGLPPVARKRLAAIKEFSDLGSGFRVAALDLEIRGAGNLLGGQQSGHIEAVGFEMYMKLLEDAVRELKGEPLEEEVRASVNLKVELRIDEQYIPDMNQRLTVYRRVAASRTEDQLESVLEDVRDRYGPPPDALLVLAAHARIRMLAERLRAEHIDRDGQTIVVRFRQDAPLDPTRLAALVSRRPDLRLVPPGALVFDLAAPRAATKPVGRGTGAVGPRRAPDRSAVSWWTARAKTGATTPGFSKEAILRQAPEDPLVAGGLFERVETLLGELLQDSDAGLTHSLRD